jgi:hypothetical protein
MAKYQKTIKRKLKNSTSEYDGLFPITKITISSDDPIEAFEEKTKLLAKPFNALDEIDSIEKQTVGFLETFGYVIRKPYKWDDPYQITETTSGTITTLVAHRFKDESDALEVEGRLASILTHCCLLRGAIENNDIDRIVEESMHLRTRLIKHNLAEKEILFRIGEAVTFGRREAARKGAENRKEKVAERDQKIIELFLSGKPTATIAQRYDTSQRNIQKIVKPYRNK